MEKQLLQLSPGDRSQMQHKKLPKEYQAVSLTAGHERTASVGEPAWGGEEEGHQKAGGPWVTGRECTK